MGESRARAFNFSLAETVFHGFPTVKNSGYEEGDHASPTVPGAATPPQESRRAAHDRIVVAP